MLRLMSDIVPALLGACADGQLGAFRSALVRRSRADRRDGGEGLSRRVREGHGDRTVSTTRRKVEGVEIFHAGTKARRRQDPRQWRARAQRVRVGQERRRGAAPAPMRPSIASTGRKASAAAISAGRLWRARRKDKPMADLADLFPGFQIRMDVTPRRAASSPASAARVRRCCCCTAIRRCACSCLAPRRAAAWPEKFTVIAARSAGLGWFDSAGAE